ncbi:MAG: cytochrome C [Betaproteobacteria bacterium HGW-Betaproteobacteria-6]|jgi:cytochrome c553|nr:MAG: cytochrome C [Betaproteobacteria bacterium HGW-Betaproteobacteria-6]
MNKVITGVLATLAFGAASVATVVTTGIVDVGADTPHHPVVTDLLGFARERAIARQSAGITAPADLDDPERIRRGAGNYAAMCVDCHLAPAMADSEIRKGLYPTPPNLAGSSPEAGAGRDPARDFWIIKHGIKASAMPAWSKGGMDDEAIWDLTAFVKAMPGLSKTAYDQLVAASDGHVHGGMDGHADGHDEHPAPLAAATPKPAAAPTAGHRHDDHDHGAHKH